MNNILNFRETYLNESFFDDIEDDIFTDTVDNTLKQIDNMNSGFYVLSPENNISLFPHNDIIRKTIYHISPNKLTFIRFDTSNITNLSSMFEGCAHVKELDLRMLYNTSNVTNMSYMFYHCISLTKINLEYFNTSNVTNMSGMFENCKELTELDLSSFDTSNVTNMYSMFKACASLSSLDLSNFNVMNIHYNMDDMFKGCKSLKYIKCTLAFKDWCEENTYIINLDIKLLQQITWDIVDNKSLNESFFDDIEDDIFTDTVDSTLKLINELCGGIYIISPHANNILYINETEKSYIVTPFKQSFISIPNKLLSLTGMFSSCCDIKYCEFIHLNTSNVFDMSHMFQCCESLTLLNLISFDTSNVLDMSNMFEYCTKLKILNLNSFKTHNVTDMFSMFRGCENIEILDLSSFDTYLVTDMSNMFYKCLSLTHLYLDNFSMYNVSKYSNMFYRCNSLKHIRSKKSFKNWCFDHLISILLLVDDIEWEIID